MGSGCVQFFYGNAENVAIPVRRGSPTLQFVLNIPFYPYPRAVVLTKTVVRSDQVKPLT